MQIAVENSACDSGVRVHNLTFATEVGKCLPVVKHVVSNGGGGKGARQRRREKRALERESVTTRKSTNQKRRGQMLFLLTESKPKCWTL